MSDDLVVFEKSNVPMEVTKFLEWYEEQTEWGSDYDYNDISHASLNLQQLFAKIRIIFPPMNGKFAPSDEELTDKPDLEERLCDYCIGKDIIYMSFAYSMADRAYNLVKRAAYFTGVGFFAPSDEDNTPNFFENCYPMFLEGEGFCTINVMNFDSVYEKLSKMTAKNHSYLYLTDQIGSYIQVGGYGDSFTVEKRVYTGCMSYVHQKAGYVNERKMDEYGLVEIAGNQVKVKQNQILSGETVRQLFLDFFQGTQTMDSVEWIDMEM